MRVKKKSLIMLVCTLIIVSGVTFGTIAYLTDSASITNHFTIGNVDIIVDEDKVDENGDRTPVDPNNPNGPFLRTEYGNEYPLIPGSVHYKDPTLTVIKGSKESYVRMIVTISNAKEIKAIFEELKALYPEKYAGGFVPGEYVTGGDNTKWLYTGTMTEDEVLNTYTLEFRYFETVEPAANENLKLPPLFTTIRIPEDLTYDQLNRLTEFSIDIDGHAIQAVGFTDAAEAWAAFDAQTKVTGKTTTDATAADTTTDTTVSDATTGDTTTDATTADATVGDATAADTTATGTTGQ